MKAKINYKSRKTIIIIAIAVILVIAAIAGTVAFIKGNNNAAAAMPEDEQTTIGDAQNNNGGDANQNDGNPSENPSDNPQTELPAVDANNNGTTTAGNDGTVTGNNDTTGTTNGGTTTNGNGTGTTTGTTTGTAGTGTTVPNQDYTQTTTVITENPWETKTIGWSPLSISAYTAAANLGINKPELATEKLAYVQGDSLDKLPENTAIQKGEVITYVIKVTNEGNLDATSIRTIDTVPEGTELVEGSITANGTESNGKITWKTDIEAGKPVELSFQVKVVADSINLIENTAKVNGTETPTTQNPVITSDKQASVVIVKGVEEALEDRDAKVGETIRYTITAINKSEVDGTTIITDKVPTGTTYVADSASEGAVVADDGTITWKKVTVPAGEEVTVSFDVTVNQDTKTSVTNIAVVGDTETPETETKVANITGTKSVDKTTAKVGDTLTYTIALTNSGNADGKVTVTDEIPAGTRIADATVEGYDAETNTMTWTDVEVKANGGTATLTLEVVIKDGTSIIKNIAYADDKKIPEEPETSVKHHYTIEHYTENLDGTYSKVEKDTVVSEDVEIGTKVSYEANNYDGFTFNDSKTENKDATVPDNNNLVVKLYYTRRTDLSYTVYYKEQGTEKELATAKVVGNQTFGNVVEEKAIDIDGYNKVDPTSGNVTITTGTNEITFYYTKRTDLSYTVYYKEQGTEKELATAKVVENQTFGNVVEEKAIDIDGYNKVEPTSGDIEITTGTNEITFYYTKRTDLSYTVYYKEQGTEKELATAKVVENQTFGNVVEEKAIDIDGYNKVEPTSGDIEITTGTNEITFYYTKRTDLSYTVYYKEQGTEKELATAKVVENQTFGNVVTETAIDIDGYNKVDPTSGDIEITTGTNEITFYYTKRTDLSYTVYYKEQGTEKELATAKVVENQTFGNVVEEKAIDIDGYNKVEPTSGDIEITTGTNEITFYYTKRTDLSYTVYYKEQGTEKELATAKVVENQTFGNVVTETAIDIDGYNKVDPTSGDIEITTGTNEITFYYTKRTDLSYTVYYKEQGTEKELATAKVVENQTFGNVVEEKAIDIDGYNKVEPTSGDIEITTGTNEITFYYTKRTDLSYTVYYKEQGTEKELATAKVVENQTFGNVVTETAIDIDGYNKVEPTSGDIEITTGTNEITFYYTKRTDLSYTVYYKEQGTEKELATAKVVGNQTFGNVVEEKAIDIDGYNKVDPTSGNVTITTGTNEITFYYTKRTDLSYTVYYKEQGTEKELATAKVVENQTFGNVVEEKAIDIDGYNKVEPTSGDIEITTGTNEITFYYTKRTDLSYTVYYKEQGTEKELATAKVVGNQTFGNVVEEKAIDIDGYNKVDPTSGNVTITTGTNEITFYYTKRTDLSYTVYYKEQGTEKELATAKVVENQTFGNVVEEKAIDIDGYNKVEPTSGDIEITTGTNEITFYYTKRTDLSYTVYYKEQGTEKELATAKVVENQTFGNVVTETAIDIDGYNKVEPTSGDIEITTGTNEITFYYTKRTDLSYTVYYKEQGTEKELATAKVVGNQTFGNVVEEKAIDIDGYNKVDPTSGNVTITTGTNEITFYYTKRTDLSYTVYYKEQGTEKELATAKVVENQTFGNVVEEKAIDIDGYNKVDPTSGDIEITTGTNEITFYYTKRTDLSYTVYYKEQGTEKELATAKVVENQTFGNVVEEKAIDIDGYNKVDPTSGDIEITTGTNEITFYYTKRTDLSYTVYYKEQGTEKELATAKVVENQTFGNVVEEKAIDIDGYNKVEPTSGDIEITTGTNEITFYYTKRTDLSYTVYYKEQGTEKELATAKVVENKTFGDVVTETAIDIDGYNKVDPTSGDIEITTGTNEITFYYTKKTDLSYTVYYKEQRTEKELATAKVVENQTFGDVVTETAIDINGYDKVAPTSGNVTITTGTNEITFYYKKANYNYHINYYYQIQNEDGTYSYQKDENRSTPTYTAKYQDVIVENDISALISANEIAGYNYNKTKTEKLPLTIGTDSTQNYINVYYDKIQYTYKVEYYTEDLNASTYTKVDSLTEENLTGKFGDTATYTVKDITGFTYKAEKTTPQNATIPANNDLVIKLYYDRNSYDYTVEYYYDGKQDTSATETLSAEYGEQVSTYPDKSNGYTFERDTGAITIGTVVANNVIKVYYAKPTFSIVKTGATTAKVGETVTYTITVTETSNKVGGTIKVTDALPEGLTFVEASDNGTKNADGDIEWSITLGKGESKFVTVKATVNNNKIGMDITNIAILDDAENEEDKTKSEKTTSVDELQAVAHELTPGQTGKDAANIILVMDLSSSMNEKIKEFVECTHKHKTWWGEEYCPEGCTEQSDGTWGQWKETSTTRLAAAKKSAQDFINSLYTDSSSKATVTVVTFNKEEVSKNNKYVGPRVLKFGTAENQTTATSSNYTQLVEAIGNIDIGTATSGYGTYIKEALDTTYDTIYGTNGVASKYPNNSNYVIFLGDGEPSDKSDSYKTKINKSADKIKNAGATIYSIGFGEDVADSESTGYKVLYGISSTPKKVYTASDSVALTNIFKNLAGGMTDKPNETTDGKIVVTPARTLYFNTENGKKEYITVQYKGTTILECKSQTDLNSSAYLSYADGKLTFDINAWNSVKGNTQITTGGEDLVLSYYIVRAD